MPRILSVATAQPEHVVRQDEAREFCRALFGDAHADIDRLLDVFANTRIEERRLAAPIDWFGSEHPFPERNALYVVEAVRLAEVVARAALDHAGVAPRDVGHLIFVSTTGIATPSLDARLMNRIDFSPHMRRTPVWGLGCAGGAAGLARAAEWARIESGTTVLLISVELCSLTFQVSDLSKSNLIATSLFADGAAAVVVGGDDAREMSARLGERHGERISPRVGPRVVAARSTLFPDTEDVMGWEVNERGLKVIFSRDIPAIVRELVRENAEEFLAEHGLALADVAHVVAHPGGTKVMSAYEEAFGLAPDAMRHAREVLRLAGNMSSPTVLFVLARFLDDPRVRPGDWGLLTALGPGFSSELVLLRW